MAKHKKAREPKTRQLTIRLPQSEARQLERLAKDNDRTISGEVRRALRRHFQAEAPPTDPSEPG